LAAKRLVGLTRHSQFRPDASTVSNPCPLRLDSFLS
jgi:hypothetical protein